MDETLEKIGQSISAKHFENLFDVPVEEARKDEEKIREALFQVNGKIWNPELYHYCLKNSVITAAKIEELAYSKDQLERINKAMGVTTVTKNEDGEIEHPVRDVKYALTKKQKWWD